MSDEITISGHRDSVERTVRWLRGDNMRPLNTIFNYSPQRYTAPRFATPHHATQLNATQLNADQQFDTERAADEEGVSVTDYLRGPHHED